MSENAAGPTGLAWEVRRFCDLATNAIESTLQQHLLEAGIRDVRPAHFRVFSYLPEEGCRLTDLATRARATKQAMNYLVDQLINRGYLERMPDLTDGRAQLIRLSPNGRELQRVAQAAIAEIELEWRSILGDARSELFINALDVLNAHLSNEREDSG